MRIRAAFSLKIIFLGAILFVFSNPNPYLHAQNLTKKIPDFKLRNLDGKLIRLSELAEKKFVLLDFWALWCLPCLKELPHLNAIQREFHENLVVVTINEDDASNQAKIKPFIRGNRYKFIVLLDPDHEVMRKAKINALPSTFLLGKELQVLYFHQGYQPGDEKKLKDIIQKNLRKKASVDSVR